LRLRAIEQLHADLLLQITNLRTDRGL
jgi:hypothetical protein